MRTASASDLEAGWYAHRRMCESSDLEQLAHGGAILADQPFSDWSVWLLILASIDLIFMALALALFEFVVEE